MLDNVPGSFPYAAGTFAFKREGEDPTRMFAGEGDAFRTNRRFKLVSEGLPAKRLSTAFDSVTLYGNDPDLRPDIYGKVGNSGVSIATLDDMKVLYGGFDLCSPSTSVSMTINGPAPTILAMFMNTAIDQQLDRFATDNGREPTDDEAAKIRAWALANVRGTVQADILKEDQGQNTCIFSTEFSLKVMGDIAEHFVRHQVRNFYSVSISGYHIAEAGANPISQLAFTLSNGFTFVEAYLARGMHVDDFAPNLSFFFSNGMDPEVHRAGPCRAAHLGGGDARPLRRQRAQPEAQVPRADLGPQPARPGDRVQRHPHHAAGADRDLRQLQLAAHECLRRGDHHSDRGERAPRDGDPDDHQPRMGAGRRTRTRTRARSSSTNMTELVEESRAGRVREDRRARRRAGSDGNRLPARQDPEESMHYEMLKHTGEYPIIGVNSFRNPHGDPTPTTLELARSTDDEKQSQLARLHGFQARHADAAPAMLTRLQEAVIADQNVFEILLDAVRCCSLGQITNALFEVGGQYRRSM